MSAPTFFLAVSDAAATESMGTVEKITKTFGLHWSLFFSQLVAFLIVCFLLKKFAYGPVMEMLE